MRDVKRSYDGTRRQAQAAATRRDVIDAAGDLFVARGYAATSIDAIAAKAGVSRETIFKSIGPKRQLLQLWVEQQVGGPDDVPIQQQPWMSVLRDTDDRQRRLEIAVEALTTIYGRSIDALAALRAAAHADPEIAELWRTACDQRRHDVTTVAALLTTDGGDEVVDVMYALTSPELCEVIVRQCGWSSERLQRWLTDALATLAVGAAAEPEAGEIPSPAPSAPT